MKVKDASILWVSIRVLLYKVSLFVVRNALDSADLVTFLLLPYHR